jgi:hypothetical protein|tara:strand:- start:2744 stop:3151 length:408 start_codon:yes stop_codon:yes gene_type:complete
MSFKKYNGNSYMGRNFWRAPSTTKEKINHICNVKSYRIGEGLKLIENSKKNNDVGIDIYLREIGFDESGRYVLLEIDYIKPETISLSPGETHILERWCSLRLMESSSFKDGRFDIKSTVGKKGKVLRLKDMVKTP